MLKYGSLLIGFVLVLAACGDSDATDTTTSSTAETTTTIELTTTTVATTTTTLSTTTTDNGGIDVEPIVPGENADADAIADVYAVVFDSKTTYEEKAPYIVDPEGLEATVDAYAAAGTGVGDIFLEVTAVGIGNDLAVVNYDLLFGGNVFQANQEGDAVRVDGTWKVTRDYFCSIMTLARVSCS